MTHTTVAGATLVVVIVHLAIDLFGGYRRRP